MSRINAAKAAEILGVSAKTVRKYHQLGYLSAKTSSGMNGPGKSLYFDSFEVKAFEEGGAVAAKMYRETKGNSGMKLHRGRGTVRAK